MIRKGCRSTTGRPLLGAALGNLYQRKTVLDQLIRSLEQYRGLAPASARVPSRREKMN